MTQRFEFNEDMSAWVIAGCTDYFPDATRIEVAPGSYQARVCYGNLTSLSSNGREGNDHYKIVLWRAAPVQM